MMLIIHHSTQRLFSNERLCYVSDRRGWIKAEQCASARKEHTLMWPASYSYGYRQSTINSCSRCTPSISLLIARASCQ